MGRGREVGRKKSKGDRGIEGGGKMGRRDRQGARE